MKNYIIVIMVLLSSTLLANGVGITNSSRGHYLKLETSYVEVHVENQIAITMSTQIYKNVTDSTVSIQYGFPLPENASAIQLKWKIDNIWYKANMTATPDQSDSGNTSEMIFALKSYLGETPLLFSIDEELPKNEKLIMELQYVELLPYDFGSVSYTYPNNFDLIQTDPLLLQNFHFEIKSERLIESLSLNSHIETYSTNIENIAIVEYEISENAANKNYEIEYTLSLDELGLFSLSTFLPDSVIPDSHGRGYFAFIAEPDPDDNTEVIEKVFTLIIDCSGSMRGEKLVQARNAASFIVNNLNDGDKFNICTFGTDVFFFKESHIEYTEQTKNEALTYIEDLITIGWTNISGALNESIKQYSNTSLNTANIIIFFTDGEATVGITDPDALLNSVTSTINDLEVPISIFTFGIGANLNNQLLSRLASENNGICEFLENDEIEEKITSFYRIIRSPVLLDTDVAFTPKVINEVHPTVFPNLYQGQQMVVVGRYQEPGTVTVNLTGNAFEQQVQYDYALVLADSNVSSNQFLPKIWAKMTIEDLLIKYHNLDPNTANAEAIKNEIIKISLAYGVICEFTDFSGGDPQLEIEDEEIVNAIPCDFKLLGNYPNPFNPKTNIQFQVLTNLNKNVVIKVYNSLGQIVRILAIRVNGVGHYSVFWDGRFSDGTMAPTGSYIYVIDFGNTLLSAKMTLMK